MATIIYLNVKLSDFPVDIHSNNNILLFIMIGTHEIVGERRIQRLTYYFLN